MDEAMTPDLEVDNTQVPEAQEQPTNEAEVGLIAAYERETGNDLDRDTPGVNELVSEYSNNPSIPQEVIVRQLINLTVNPETEEPEVQIEQPVVEEPLVEKAPQTETQEILEPEVEPLSPEVISNIVSTAERLSKLKNINVSTPDFYDVLNTSPEKSKPEEIKLAFRAVQRETHPDTFSFLSVNAVAISDNTDVVNQSLLDAGLSVDVDDLGQAEQIANVTTQLINEAYSVLNNPEAKRVYDWYRDHKDVKLDSGMSIYQTYFGVNEAARVQNMEKWDAQIKDQEKMKARTAQRKQEKEQKDRDWQARQEEMRREKREKANNQPPASDIPTPVQEPVTAKKYEDQFDATKFFNGRETSPLREPFTQAYRYSSDGLSQRLSEAMGFGKSTQFMNDYSNIYKSIRKDNSRLVLDFSDDISILSASEMLRVLNDAVRMPQSRAEIHRKLAEAFVKVDMEPNISLSGIIEKLIANAEGTEKPSEPLQKFVLLLTQMKTRIEIAQIFGTPLPFGEIMELCQLFPNIRLRNNRSLQQLILSAAMQEVFNGKNEFMDDEMDEVYFE